MQTIWLNLPEPLRYYEIIIIAHWKMICIHVYAPIKKYLKHTGLYLKLRSPIKVENMFTQQTDSQLGWDREEYDL